MTIRTLLTLSILVPPFFALSRSAADPWPAESSAQAIDLTSIDCDFKSDLSGAFWNSDTETLWVCRNGPNSLTSKLWALVDNGGGFVIDFQGQPGVWTGFGDLEAVTQADLAESVVYLIDENTGRIKEYDVTVYGTQCINNDWNTGGFIPEDFNGCGAEGITFVPDAFLTNFVDLNGISYTSTRGMGGLMFVSHQLDGSIFVFDLDRTNATFDFVGEYRTAFVDTAGLEFDRSTGLLYAWHDDDDRLTVLDLTSVAVFNQTYRRFNTIAIYDGPTNDDEEGIAIAPIDDCSSGVRNFFTTIDNGGVGTSLVQYQCFSLECPPPDCLQGTVNEASGVIEDVFFVNGSAGNANREVTICTNTQIDLCFQASSAGSGVGRYWLYIWISAPSGSPFYLTLAGEKLGCFALPTPFHGGVPQPFRCLSGSVPGVVCNGVAVVAPAGTGSVPWMLSIPSGLANPNTLTFQGAVQDFGANNGLGYSVTNGVVLNVQ